MFILCTLQVTEQRWASIGCPSAVVSSSSGSTLHSCEYESLMCSCRWDCRPSCRCDFRHSCRWDCRPSCRCFLQVGNLPVQGGAAKIFNFESNTCNLFSFVQPPSAGSNNPASVSPAADHVNPSPQSGPSPLSRGPHLQFPSPQ